jgi:hypothetical protein
MRLRFQAARSVRSTRYAIIGADLVEYVRRPAPATVPQILKALPDPVGGIGFRCEVKQVLVGFGILHDRCRLAVHRQDNRALGVPQVPHDLRPVIVEGGHRLDVFGDVHLICLSG